MGLFSKSQKREVLRFPKLPEKPVFPEYRAQIPAPEPFRVKIPELSAEEAREEFNIPIRRPEMPRPVALQEFAPALSMGSQPLFVKIDKYKSAIKALDEIKQKISEAENTLTRLNAIKLRESDEIARWEEEMRNMKEKLMAIDKNLFEA